jgi:hypothetical protein
MYVSVSTCDVVVTVVEAELTSAAGIIVLVP